MKALASYITVLFTALWSIPAHSQDVFEYTKRVACSEPKIVFKVLQEEYGEVFLMVGEVHGGKTAIAVFANPKSGSWSIVEYNEKQACVINSGTKAIKNGKFV